MRHLLVGWGKLGSNGTQRALFLHASPIPIRPVRARRRLGASCERVVVRAERHIPACTLGQSCSPASILKTHQRKPAGERTRWPRKPPGQPPLPGLLVLLTHGVPREDPRRAHVVRGPQKDTRQLLSALPAPPAPFQRLGGVYMCQTAAADSQPQDTASLYGVMTPFPAAQEGHRDRSEFYLHPKSLVETKRVEIEYRNSPTVGIGRTGNGSWRHSVSFQLQGTASRSLAHR